MHVAKAVRFSVPVVAVAALMLLAEPLGGRQTISQPGPGQTTDRLAPFINADLDRVRPSTLPGTVLGVSKGRSKSLLYDVRRGLRSDVARSATPVRDTQGLRRAPWAELETRLQETVRALDGVAGYAVLDLTSGERLANRGDEQFPAASVIKLAILLELFHQAGQGVRDLGALHPFGRRIAVGGTGVLARLSVPALSLRDYAVLMIEVSDNTATNILIDLVGMERVNARLSALGLDRTRLRRRMMNFEAARRGEDNVATPLDLVRLLEAIHRGTGLPAAAHADLLAILKQPPAVSYLRRGIPAEIEVASKYGTLDGVRADAGIVYVESRPFALAVMTRSLREGRDGERMIEEMARITYDHFSRSAAAAHLGGRAH